MLDTQQQYAIDQYNLCCRHLKINPRYDDPGHTLFETIVGMETDIKTLDKECWDYRLNTWRKNEKLLFLFITVSCM